MAGEVDIEAAQRSRRIVSFMIVCALLGWVALVIQFWLSLRFSVAQGESIPSGIGIYFSYFTILTNIIVAMALTLPLVKPRSSAAAFLTRPSIQSGIAASIVLVGGTYSVLLRRVWDPKGLQLVADVLLHEVIPVLFLVYWWFGVPKTGLRWSNVAQWMLYPIGYFLFVLARGALTGFYPYFFIDASTIGYGRAVGNAMGILLGFVTAALLLVAAGRLKSGEGFTRNTRSVENA